MIKNPLNSDSWTGIKNMSDSEREVVEKIIDLYKPEIEETDAGKTAVIEGAAVIDYADMETAQKAAEAFKIRGFNETTVYQKKPSVRVPYNYQYDADEINEIIDENDLETEKEILTALKETTAQDIFADLDAVSTFLGEVEEKTTVYINKAYLEPGKEVEDTDKPFIFAFNTGRVNANTPVDDILDDPAFAEYADIDNIDRIVRLGQLVTRTQAFESTDLGKLLESALPSLLKIGSAFLSILF